MAEGHVGHASGQLRFRAISIQQWLQRHLPGASSTPPSGGRSPWQRPEQKRKLADSRKAWLAFSEARFRAVGGDKGCIQWHLRVQVNSPAHANKEI